MRFASLGGSNAGNYAAAGKSVADSAARMHAVQRKTGPDYTGLSKAAMQTASNEKVAGMQAEAKLTNVAQAQYAKNTQNAINIKKFNKGEEIKASQRKAGGLAAIGKIAGAGFLASRDNTKGRERPKADRKSINDKYRTDLAATTERQNNEVDKHGPFKAESFKSGDSAGKVAPAVNAAKATSGTSLLTGNAKFVADSVAVPESGDWGYEAFNQGGAASGTKVLGKSGSYLDTYGTSLTAMSLGDIFHKQNTKQRGLSMDQHLKSGGLHAVGRYQFIGPTLQDEVNRMGLSHDTKFTPEIQDKIFINHIKRVGNISPWVGPSTKWDQSKKNQINGMIAGL